MRYLLKNGTVVSAEQSVQADVLIEGEKIIGVGKGLDENGAEVIDVSGKLLFPGFIDGHTPPRISRSCCKLIPVI